MIFKFFNYELRRKKMAKKAPITNKEFASTDTNFQKACEAAGCEATSRQASRWRMRKGKAWFQMHPATK